MKKLLIGITMILALISCGSKNVEDEKVGSFATEWRSEKDPIEGQTYKVAVVNDSAFKGVLDPLHWTDSIDRLLLGPLDGALLWTNDSYQLIDGGMANLEIDEANNTIIYKLRDGLKWSDGYPLTVDDIIFAYEIVGHPDYTGVRYGAAYENVVGMEEYHSGKAKKISGLEKVSDTELKVHLKEIKANIRALGGGVMTSLEPKHYLENENIKTLESNEKIRTKPLSYGPYVIEKIVPGESILYKPNPYYWNDADRPEVKEMTYKLIPTASVISSIKAGEYDSYTSFTADLYRNIKNLDNIAILGSSSLSYNYIGFKLGKYDEEKQEAVPNENAKTFDIRVRKAMLYALDLDTITSKLFENLKFRANGVIPPVLKDMYDKEVGQYPYDVEKANKLLDDAGLLDIDGDGIRENAKGEKLTIYFAIPNVYSVSEPLSQAYIQYWKAIGLNVELTNGRLQEWQTFLEMIRNDVDNVDIFAGGWGLGTTLEFANLYSGKARFNFARYTTPENEELLKDLTNSAYINDNEKRIEAYKKFNKYYSEEVLGFAPIMFNVDISPINKRIKYATTKGGNDSNNFPLQLVDTAPYASK